MNERIRELTRQVYGPSLMDHENFVMNNDKMERFAELIVAECMNVAVNKDAGISYTADVAGYVAAGRSNAARAIKQHFEGI
jgi:hypothetical protein